MFKLVIVSGPNRGSAFELREGENVIGRDTENSIVLSSGRVSKKHCVIVLRDGEVRVQDEGSTNGTFLNGELVKRSNLNPGDKVSVGDFVLELVGRKPSKSPAGGFDGNAAISFDNSPFPLDQKPVFSGVPVSQLQNKIDVPNQIVVAEPDDPIEKVKLQLEVGVMPFFYNWLMKTDYKIVIACILVLLTVSAAISSLMPTLDLVQKSVEHEALRRAKVLARSVTDRYALQIAQQNYSEIELTRLNREDGVRMVAITSPTLSIIAPQSRVNQKLAGGVETTFLLKFAKEVNQGLTDKGRGDIVAGGVAVYVDPIVVTDSRTARPSVAAFAIVSVDYSKNQFAESDQMVLYATSTMIALLIALVSFLLITRISMKPFEVLSDELDQVLRGSLPRVTNEFKLSNLKPMFDSINAIIQKTNSGSAGGSGQSQNTEFRWDAEASGLQALADSIQDGFCALDNELKLVSLNTYFEDISGIRATGIGSHISQVGRDRAFISLVEDLHSRLSSMSFGAIQENFEFSGTYFSLTVLGIGPTDGRGVAIFFRKKEES